MNGKKVLQRLLYPPAWLTVLLTLLAAAGMAYSAIKLGSTHPLSIAAYTLSFYALVILCVRVPRMVMFVRRFRRENPFYLRYSTDLQLRMGVSLCGAFVWNAAYALFQLVLGLVYRSVWFYAMAGYYLLLSAMRWMLARQIRRTPPGQDGAAEWRRYRLCGAGLVMMNLSLLVFLVCFVRQLRDVRHHQVVTIAMAAYTFTSMAVAVSGVLRYRRYESPVCSAAKAVSLASALVSMLSLENTMLSTFHEGTTPLFRRIMLGASGAVISLCILSMAVYMMLHATKAVKKCK